MLTQKRGYLHLKHAFRLGHGQPMKIALINLCCSPPYLRGLVGLQCFKHWPWMKVASKWQTVFVETV